MAEQRLEDAASPPTGETELTEEPNEGPSVIHTTGEQNGLLILEAPLPRPIKHRPTFTEDQVATMETIFEQRQYLSPMERESVASSVGLSPQQVRVWFQNRRQKVKQFLNQKQMRNGQQPLVNGRNRQETGDNSSSSSGGSTIGSLTAQQLTNNIDPILQLLLPKMIENGEESRGVAKNEDNASTSNEKDAETLITALEQVTKEGAEKGVESVTPITSATPAITLTPAQTLLCLTPYLLPLQLQSSTVQLPGAGKGTGNPTSTISIPANAIQLLQGLSNSSSSSQLQTIPLQLAKVFKQNKAQPQIIGSPSIVPLKAQSPTRIDFSEEASEIKSEESTSQHVVDAKSEQGTNDVTNPVLTGVSSEILQQLLGGISGDGLKTSWNVTPSTSVVTSHTTNTSLESPRKKRQVFSGVQTTELEKQFEISPYIDAKERDKLAEKIGLHPDQVKVWFQNRRTKQNRVSWRHQREPTENQ